MQKRKRKYVCTDSILDFSKGNISGWKCTGNAKICIPRGRSGKESRRREKQKRKIRNGEVKVKVERIERVKGREKK